MPLRFLWPAILLLGAAGRLPAQAVRVYSEFQRIDPFGNVVPVDRAERPREILSPALARNAFASYTVVIAVPDEPYHIFVGQNPEDAVGVTLYRQLFLRRGDAWIPDGLEPLPLSETGMVPGVPLQVSGQRVLVLWMDLWVAPDAPVQRNRLEVQVNVGEHWIIYPMELRILSAVVPEPTGPLEPLTPVEAPSADAAAGPLKAYVCGPAGKGSEATLTMRNLIRRNARQDMALARSLEPAAGGRSGVVSEILDAVGAGERQSWCQRPGGPKERGSEWYLRVRDYLYRTAGTEPLPEAMAPTISAMPVP